MLVVHFTRREAIRQIEVLQHVATNLGRSEYQAGAGEDPLRPPCGQLWLRCGLGRGLRVSPGRPITSWPPEAVGHLNAGALHEASLLPAYGSLSEMVGGVKGSEMLKRTRLSNPNPGP